MMKNTIDLFLMRSRMEQQVVRKRSFQHIILKRLYLHKTLGDRTYLRLILWQGQFKKKGRGVIRSNSVSDDILDCHRTSFARIWTVILQNSLPIRIFYQGDRVQV